MKLMVLDGNSIVNRAFYGIRLLSTQDGLYTNAVYGFLTILQRLVDEEQPDALCVTFDLKAPTFRHLAYDGYKATRHGMPEELAMQMPVLKEVLDAMNIPRYQLEGWEADDLLGTISRKCEAAGWECAIVTGDKDSLQLITDHTKVKLVSTRMGQTTTKDMTPDSFREAYGFDPIHMIDLKSLMGDSSDNIPGVKGVGEKTAVGLIQKYGSMEAIYADFDNVELKPAMRKKLDEGREMAKLSYDLATIRCDAPIDFKPEDALRRPVDNDALYALFLKLEFAKLIGRYGLTPPQRDAAETEEVEFRVEGVSVLSENQMADIWPKWENADHVIRVVENLRKKGYIVEMDDFGTGYSSLNMLSSMPIDVLKMDRAFVRNIEHSEKDIQLVGLILDIAKNMNIPVIAEGVETEEQIRLLKDLGCDLVQGYYFSKPLHASDFERKFLSNMDSDQQAGK